MSHKGPEHTYDVTSTLSYFTLPNKGGNTSDKCTQLLIQFTF
jgi:hypothetical protein